MSWSSGGPTSGNDTFTGTTGNDSASALAGDDSLYGDAGSDTLNGEGGNDTIQGGAGADSLVGGADIDFVDYSASAAAVDIVLNSSANEFGDAEGDTLSGFEGVIGSSSNDTILGTGSSDTLIGGAGSDLIDGANGSDFLLGEAGIDTLIGGNDASANTLVGGLDGDSLVGGLGNDQLVGDQTNDSTQGGNDTLVGGDGNDSLFGNFGNDTLSGGEGDDYLFGNAGNDSIVDVAGSNLVQGGDGDDTVIGGANADTVVGGAGNDLVLGGQGGDVYYIGLEQGNDTINDGGGNDTLYLEGFNTTTGFPPLTDGTTYGEWTFTSLTAGSGILTRTNAGGGTDSIYLDNTINTVAPGDDFILPPDDEPCFAAGTMIATARGEVPVEKLRVGDLVLTADGGAPLKPVVWLGHSRANVSRHPRPERIAPVLIKAGALAEGVPHRDLRVSPDHGMFLDGVLVPAKHLVNGTTIIQEMWCPEVTYWHVELPAHGLLVAEGAVSESYLDDGNRKNFDNYGITTLFKDFASERANGRYAAQSCRRVLEDGPQLDRIREKVAARVGAVETSARRSA